MSESSNKSPYRGTLPTILALCAVPIVLAWLFEKTLLINQPFWAVVNRPSARFVGFGAGFVFQIICIMCGLLRDSFRIVRFRIKEFFENLPCSVGFAFQCYWEDIKSDGIVFDLYLLVILGTLGYSLYNLQVALKMLHII